MHVFEDSFGRVVYVLLTGGAFLHWTQPSGMRSWMFDILDSLRIGYHSGNKSLAIRPFTRSAAWKSIWTLLGPCFDLASVNLGHSCFLVSLISFRKSLRWLKLVPASRRALFMRSSTSPGWLIVTRISRSRVLFVLVGLPTRLARRTEISPLSMLSDLRKN